MPAQGRMPPPRPVTALLATADDAETVVVGTGLASGVPFRLATVAPPLHRPVVVARLATHRLETFMVRAVQAALPVAALDSSKGSYKEDVVRPIGENIQARPVLGVVGTAAVGGQTVPQVGTPTPRLVVRPRVEIEAEGDPVLPAPPPMTLASPPVASRPSHHRRRVLLVSGPHPTGSDFPR